MNLDWEIEQTTFKSDDKGIVTPSTVDLSKISGEDLFKLYEYAFPQLALRGLQLFNGVINRHSLQNNLQGPDLLREIIIRTLEFEYNLNYLQTLLFYKHYYFIKYYYFNK